MKQYAATTTFPFSHFIAALLQIDFVKKKIA